MANERQKDQLAVQNGYAEMGVLEQLLERNRGRLVGFGHWLSKDWRIAEDILSIVIQRVIKGQYVFELDNEPRFMRFFKNSIEREWWKVKYRYQHRHPRLTEFDEDTFIQKEHEPESDIDKLARSLLQPIFVEMLHFLGEGFSTRKVAIYARISERFCNECLNSARIILKDATGQDVDPEKLHEAKSNFELLETAQMFKNKKKSYKFWMIRRLSCLKNFMVRKKESGRVVLYFPRIVLRFLSDRPLFLEPVGDWLSVRGIVEKAGIERYRVLQNLLSCPSSGELRISIFKKIVACFPPRIVDEILQRETPKDAFDNAGDYLNLNQICKSLDTDDDRVKRAILSLGIVSETRISPQGLKLAYYHPDCLEEIRDFLSSTPPAGDWLSLGQIAKELNESTNWVTHRLQNKPFEWRLSLKKHNRVKHYPSEIIRELMALKATK